MANELNRLFSKEEIQMSNKYLKKCSTSACREMQVKTTRRFRLIPARKAVIKNTNNGEFITKCKNKCRRGCGEKEACLYCWWGCRSVPPLWKSVWSSCKRLGMKPPCDPLCAAGCLSWRIKVSTRQHIPVHGHTIHDGQARELALGSTSRWTDRNVVHTQWSFLQP